MWKCYHLDAGVSCNLVSASYQICMTSLINEFVLLVISWCCWPSLLSRSAKFSQTSFQFSFTVSPRASSHEITALIRIWNRICFLKLSGDCGTWNMSVLPDYFINLLSKPYDLGKKSLFLYYYDAVSSWYNNLFCHELCVYVEHRHVGNRNRHIGICYHNGHLFVY